MPDIPPDAADHAEQFGRRYAGGLDRYCALRMEELGIPSVKIGASVHEHGIPWCAFNPHDRGGGGISTGITVESGALNPDPLKGQPGGRAWARARLRDRIDAVLAHEYEEDRHGTHRAALRAAPRTALPITDGARRILRAMARRRPSSPPP
jgi:hypothetical protein